VTGIPSGTSVAPLAFMAGAAGSSANDTFAFLPSVGESALLGSTDLFSNPGNGDHLAGFWSDPAPGSDAVFQAGSGHLDTLAAGNHDGHLALGFAELTHGFIIR
jgi:hypothetical protein